MFIFHVCINLFLFLYFWFNRLSAYLKRCSHHFCQCRDDFSQRRERFVDVCSFLRRSKMEKNTFFIKKQQDTRMKCEVVEFCYGFSSSNNSKEFHLQPGPFGSGGIGPLAARQIHQADFTDLQQRKHRINNNNTTPTGRYSATGVI